MKFDFIQLFFLGTFALSFIGILVIVHRKSAVLAGLPDSSFQSFSAKNMFEGILKGLQNVPAFKNFSFEFFLHKVLSRIRVVILKTDSKTSLWLQQLRERAKRKRTAQIDNYWQELRKLTKRRKTTLPKS